MKARSHKVECIVLKFNAEYQTQRMNETDLENFREVVLIQARICAHLPIECSDAFEFN